MPVSIFFAPIANFRHRSLCITGICLEKLSIQESIISLLLTYQMIGSYFNNFLCVHCSRSVSAKAFFRKKTFEIGSQKVMFTFENITYGKKCHHYYNCFYLFYYRKVLQFITLHQMCQDKLVN